MALAILECIGENKGKVWFQIDTGSNPYYQLKVGKGVTSRDSNSFIDGVVYSTQVGHNEAGGQLFNSSTKVGIPADRFDRNTKYVQLFSYKTPQGKSPAFSRVVKVPLGLSVPSLPYAKPPDLALSASMPTTEFARPRSVACRTCKQAFSQQASIEDVLSGILKLAAPVVLDALKSSQGAGVGGGSSAGSSGAIGDLLKVILSALGTPAPPIGSAAAGGSKPMSLPDSGQYSRPFIFGIDDALLASLAGPVLQSLAGPLLQSLPQLINAGNQQRLQMKQEDNKLISGILTDINKRLLMDKILEAQKQQPAATNGAPAASPQDVQKLLEILAAAQPSAPAQPAPAVAQAKSLSVDPGSLSSKAVLAFDFDGPVQWQGASRILFARNQAIKLNVKLAVAEPAPKSPLEKAIVRVVFKGTDHKQLAEKSFRLKQISANAPLVLDFTAADLARLPANSVVSVIAEMRWQTPRGERKALGSAEIVLVDRYFVKEKGSAASTEFEPRDQNRFRAFWNKVWEAPTLDSGTNKGDTKKFNWELDVVAKYTVLLSADHPANGMMETKILQGESDPESLTARFDGKMKAGIELSLGELDKLSPMFDKGVQLDPEIFHVIATSSFAQAGSGEVTYPLKLKGKAGQRGVVWMIPIFRQFEVVLGTTQNADPSGQITAVGEQKVQFPLPVAIRALGLRSNPDAETSEDSGDYKFDGFEVVFSEKIALTPAGGSPNG